MRIWLSLLFFLSCIFIGCNTSPHQKRIQEWMSNRNKLKVLTTTGMIGDIVAQVGGSYIDNFVLIPDQLDPHTYQLVKGDDEKLRCADLIFYNGLNLEHGPSLQAALKESSKAISVGDAIAARQPKAILRLGNQVDPHIWMDVSLWAEAIPSIVSALSQADPMHTQEYIANGQQTTKALLTAHDAIRQTLHHIPPSKRFLVTSHDAFHYFARAYLAEDGEISNHSWQQRCAAPEGLAPDSQLSVSDIQAIISHLDTHHILVVFPESNVSKDSIRKIVDAGVQKGLHLIIADGVLYADAMGASGSTGATYLGMLSHNAALIAQYLGSNGEEARAQFLKVKGGL